MFIRGNVKKCKFSTKASVIIGLVFLLLVLVFLCGHFQSVNSFSFAIGMECNKILSSIGHAPFKEDFLLYGFLLSALAIFATAIKRKISNNQIINHSFFSLHGRVGQSFSKFISYLSEAFSNGILHPQLYKLFFIIS